MADITKALSDNQAAVTGFAADVDQLASTWTTPRAPGKWSPSEVTEHVSRALDESAKMVAGEPNKFLVLPFFIRPLARWTLYDRVVASGNFPKAKTNRPMNPILEGSSPKSPTEGRKRLEAAAAGFYAKVRALPADARVLSLAFGNIAVHDWVVFQTAHLHHHQQQLR